MENTQQVKIPLLDKLGYGVGNLGFGIIFQLVTTYLVFYSTAVLEIPGSLIGIGISISVIWDGISDPVVGYISDKTNIRGLGRRHLYILVGTLILPLVNFQLWNIDPTLSTSTKFLLVLVNVLLVKSFLTVFGTPHIALGAELTSDYDERSWIQGIRTLFFLLGLFGATVVGMFFLFKPTEQFPIGQLNPQAYYLLGLSSSLLMFVVGVVCFLATKKHIPRLHQESASREPIRSMNIVGLLRTMFRAFKNRAFKFVVLGYLCTNIASALVGAVGLHVFTYTFNMNNVDIAIIFGLLFAIAMLSQPVWVMISRRIDKQPTIILGLIISLIGTGIFLVMVFFREAVDGSYIYMIPFAVLTGFGSGGLFSLPYSMIADTVDLEEWKSGTRSEGVYFGSLTLSYKMSQSIAIFLLGLMLDVIGFDASLEFQSPSTLLTLGLVLGVGSLLSMGIAVLVYRKYDLDKDLILEIQHEIALKKV